MNQRNLKAVIKLTLFEEGNKVSFTSDDLLFYDDDEKVNITEDLIK
jgi:hypothetical protein